MPPPSVAGEGEEMKEQENSVCYICGKPAVTNYPLESAEDEMENSCGSARCEYLMQQGMDFHEECGDR